jgi:hypothetical protein
MPDPLLFFVDIASNFALPSDLLSVAVQGKIML